MIIVYKLVLKLICSWLWYAYKNKLVILKKFSHCWLMAKSLLSIILQSLSKSNWIIFNCHIILENAHLKIVKSKWFSQIFVHNIAFHTTMHISSLLSSTSLIRFIYICSYKILEELVEFIFYTNTTCENKTRPKIYFQYLKKEITNTCKYCW